MQRRHAHIQRQRRVHHPSVAQRYVAVLEAGAGHARQLRRRLPHRELRCILSCTDQTFQAPDLPVSSSEFQQPGSPPLRQSMTTGRWLPTAVVQEHSVARFAVQHAKGRQMFLVWYRDAVAGDTCIGLRGAELWTVRVQPDGGRCQWPHRGSGDRWRALVRVVQGDVVAGLGKVVRRSIIPVNRSVHARCRRRHRLSGEELPPQPRRQLPAGFSG